jgi:rhodanese-related sulfurtransferase
MRDGIGGNDMPQNITIGAKDLVEQARAEITELSPADAQAAVAKGALIVDIRDVRELEREGAIPGSFHAPRGMLEFWIDPKSPYYKPVFGEDRQYIFHCASGWRSALATQQMSRMGLKPVAHIAGGFTAWKAAGLPVEAKKG